MIARTTFLLALGASTAAFAQGPARFEIIGGQTKMPGILSPEERFAAADANHDGKVDKAELQASLLPDAKPFIDAIWANRDANKDGWLTKDELTSNGPPSALRPGPVQAAQNAQPAAAAK